MMNKIAVIMSLYIKDKVEYVSLAVESVLNQSYSNFDFYIQFDGVVDNSIEKYFEKQKDKRIIIHRRHNNRGLAFSLNELLCFVMPKGYNYIARMDADDINETNRFERQIGYLISNPNVECLGCWAIEINSKGDEYYRKQMPETHEGCYKLFMKRDCIIHPTVIYRRSFIEKAGFYSLDTYFGEDTMMWAQGFSSGCIFANIPEYLYKFRLDDNFFNRRRGWKHAKNIFLLRHKVNKMLHYGMLADVWAFLYAGAKLMPTSVLSCIYKIAR